jgi:hypothetical protein
MASPIGINYASDDEPERDSDLAQRGCSMVFRLLMKSLFQRTLACECPNSCLQVLLANHPWMILLAPNEPGAALVTVVGVSCETFCDGLYRQ